MKGNRVEQRPDGTIKGGAGCSRSTRRYERVIYVWDYYGLAACLGGRTTTGCRGLNLGSDLVKEIRLRGLGRPQVGCLRPSLSPGLLRKWRGTGRMVQKAIGCVCIGLGVRRLLVTTSIEVGGRRKLRECD